MQNLWISFFANEIVFAFLLGEYRWQVRLLLVRRINLEHLSAQSWPSLRWGRFNKTLQVTVLKHSFIQIPQNCPVFQWNHHLNTDLQKFQFSKGWLSHLYCRIALLGQIFWFWFWHTASCKSRIWYTFLHFAWQLLKPGLTANHPQF